MKIVFIAPFGIRPKGTLIARMLPLAVELQRLGHEVVIVAPPYTNPEDSGKVELVEGVLLRNIRLGPRHKVLAAPVLAWRLLMAAQSESPDLIHLFKPKGYGGLAAMLQLLLGKNFLKLPPLLVDTDDWEGQGGMNDQPHGYSDFEKRFYAFQECWLLQRAAGITVASRGLESLVSKTVSSFPKLLYLPNCVRQSRLGNGTAVREHLGIAATAPVVLLYTRFFEFEQARLHHVMGAIRQQVPQVRFLVVGKGRHDEEALLLEAGRKAGFADALILAGWVEPANLPDYLAVGNVSIYPLDDNLVNRCKCPAKLTEVLLAGVAVVADRVGQAAEYIEHDLSGILTDPGDWRTMGMACISLLTDPDKCRCIGENGRRYVLDRFNWVSYAENLNDFYREYIN